MNDTRPEGEQEIDEWEARQKQIEAFLANLVEQFHTLRYLMVAVLVAFTVRGGFDILLFQHQDQANRAVQRQGLIVCDLYKRLKIRPPVGACPAPAPHSANQTFIVIAALSIVGILGLTCWALRRRGSSVPAGSKGGK